jgi:hypothetical protein
MLKRALYSLIPLVVLAGCPLMRDTPVEKSATTKPIGSGGGGTVGRCTVAADCKVNIIVTACSVGGIRAEPNTLHVAPTLKNVTITWTIRTSLAGITFGEKGIDFKENKKFSLLQFRASRTGAGGTTWEWLDQNISPGTFPYDVNVRQNGTACPVHDPIIVND